MWTSAVSPQESRRLALLLSLNVLDTPPVEELDRITRLAIQVFGVPVALVSLVDQHREWFKSRVGLDLTELTRERSFCTHAIQQAPGLLVVEDARQDPRFQNNPIVQGDPLVVFYAGQTLYSREGLALGTLCVIDHQPRTFTPANAQALRDLARLAENYFHQLELMVEARRLDRDSGELEHELRESERRYRALFNNRTNGIAHLRMVTDATGRVVNYYLEAINDAWLRIMKMQRPQVEGCLITEVFPGIDRLADFDFLEPYATVALEGGEAHFECYFELTDQWFSVYAYSPAHGECIVLFMDISEQKRAEAALRDRERALVATFDQAGVGIAHVGPGGSFLRVNRKLQEMLGYTEEELQQKCVKDLSPAEDHEDDLRAFHRTLTGELDTFTRERRYRRRNGSLLWCRISVTSVRDQAGGGAYSLVMIEDIADRKRAEDELSQERAQLQAVFESIDDGVAVFDMQGNIVLANTALARINRFATVGDMRQNLSYFGRMYELSERDGSRLSLEQWPGARVLRGESFADWELQARRLDIGRSWHFSFSGKPIYDEQGRQILALLVNRDITARYRLERELQKAHRDLEARVERRTVELRSANEALNREKERTRVVLETATDAYVATDAEGRVRDWNRAAEKMFGWARHEVLGQPVRPFIIPERFRDRYERSLRLLGTNGELRGLNHVTELVARHRGGHEFPVDMSLSTNCFGDSWTISAFIRDISGRKQAEEALRVTHDDLAQSLIAEQAATRAAESARLRAEEAMRAAEAANRAKSEFLATMSHEIRTPLNGVIGFNGLLLDGPLTEDKRRYAELARQSGESLLHLLNDFLDFSKIEAGHLELEPLDFDPYLEVGQALGLVRDSAERKGLALSSHVQAPTRVRGDAARLRQILLNLLGNAVKFTESGSISVTCEELTRANGQVWLQFQVKDTGIGIAGGAQERLFQPFSQADASTTRRFGGTGLGLAICRRLAEAMGGKIGVSSTPGKGSTFWIRLPFDLREMGVGRLPEMPVEPPPVAAGQSPRGRVLVVEDNSVSQLMLVEMLKKMGCRVDAVGNGLEAVEAMRRLPYDLVLMDCDMPVMNGFDATLMIRAEEAMDRRVPIVAITASALRGDSERCLAVGMDDFMSKPVRFSELGQMVDKWLPKRCNSPA